MAELTVLLLLITISLLVVRAGAIALHKTGIPSDVASFQSQSAFMGVGFTTLESEEIMDDPVRRRIVRALMLLGFGAITSTMGTVMVAFTREGSNEYDQGQRLLILLTGLLALWIGRHIRPLQQLFDFIVTFALEKFTDIRVISYEEMLRLGKGYSVASLPITHDSWLTGKNLRELALTEEGVLILSIERQDGTTIGTPSSTMELETGDKILCYGKNEDLAHLRDRRVDRPGKIDHALAKRRQRLRVAEERVQDHFRAQQEEDELHAHDHDHDHDQPHPDDEPHPQDEPGSPDPEGDSVSGSAAGTKTD